MGLNPKILNCRQKQFFINSALEQVQSKLIQPITLDRNIGFIFAFLTHRILSSNNFLRGFHTKNIEYFLFFSLQLNLQATVLFYTLSS